MRLAVIADIHGNSAALSAVLDDIDALGIREVINLGDHFSGPLDAAGVAETLQGRDFLSIRGNHDRWLVEQPRHEMAASDQAAFDQLDATHLAWLRSLPATAWHGEDVFLCHGTPLSDLTYWMERVDNDGTVRAATLSEVEAEVGDVTAGLILCAHTHVPRVVRTRSGQVILNPGSVGCPAYNDTEPVFHEMQTGTPNASYAIAELGHAGWCVSFRSIPYDSSRMAKMATAAKRPEWARAVATGWL